MARRFEMGERVPLSALSERGTVSVRAARAYGYGDRFETSSPCCSAVSRISATIWAGTGALVTCSECKWKWEVHLALDGKRLSDVPRDAGHPQIRCNQAEWVSRGFGTRPYRRIR